MREYKNLGCSLLAEHQELEVRLMQSGREGLLSLIHSCIDGGWNTNSGVLAKVQQIGGPYYDVEVPQLLALHASPLARPQLWTKDAAGRYENVESGWRTGLLETCSRSATTCRDGAGAVQ